ncbi:biotin synthase [Salsuginibacillus halophilus]|uniref:Biotin synthase n=1 Tax=Salsuginibacillus halophilus TaxID=517424 RepID=A0A2P8HX69_9BACI|nr:biotin synthase BioB [Salsuginibacillus halophilus]PSL50807.1 biotin synthase [Salsuginibacillus halophilus]
MEDMLKRVMQGESLRVEEGVTILNQAEKEILPALQHAYHIRYQHFGDETKLNMIINAKNGLCPENCGYCAQSSVSTSNETPYQLLSKEQLVAGAAEAERRKAGTYCIVASGRGPSRREVSEVADAVTEIKNTYDLKICACLGLLKEGQAAQLEQAGVDRYNHNVNTHKDHHDHITTSHTYDDRVTTVNEAKSAGISPCSGIIAGMGETDEQLIDTMRELRELKADSVPINFLHPVPGTPLGDRPKLSPQKALAVLVAARFMLPDKEIRVAGGREEILRSMQPLALYPANAIFVGDYLTTDGQTAALDHDMIEAAGFKIESESKVHV